MIGTRRSLLVAQVVAASGGPGSYTGYPDAHPESTSVDGPVIRTTTSQTLANIRAGAGVSADDTLTTYDAPRLYASTTADQYQRLNRAIFLFDTSSIPAEATITSVTLSLRCTAKANGLGSPELDVVDANPASNTAVVAADFANVGTTVYGSVAYADVSTAAYTNITLDTAAVTKAGITKLGLRLNWDTDNSFTGTWASTGSSSFTFTYADNGSNKPTLTVEYTT